MKGVQEHSRTSRQQQRWEANRRYRLAHPEKVKEFRKRRYENNKDTDKDRRLQTKYGITLAQWEAMFISQDRCCAICKSPDPKTRWGWHTDHEPGGRVRGILCRSCNITVGHVEKPLLNTILTYIGRAMQ